jgi:Flp pilus assembly protein protease CpaA
MYRFLCGVSYALVIVLLLAGAAAVGSFNAAWAKRRPDVSWIESVFALRRADLFPPEAQLLRRRALREQRVVTALFVVVCLLVLLLTRMGGADSCWAPHARARKTAPASAG